NACRIERTEHRLNQGAVAAPWAKGWRIDRPVIAPFVERRQGAHARGVRCVESLYQCARELPRSRRQLASRGAFQKIPEGDVLARSSSSGKAALHLGKGSVGL